MWNKVKWAYDEWKTYFSTSETTQLDHINDVDDKYHNSFIAENRCLNIIFRHFARLNSPVFENLQYAIATLLTPTFHILHVELHIVHRSMPNIFPVS